MAQIDGRNIYQLVWYQVINVLYLSIIKIQMAIKVYRLEHKVDGYGPWSGMYKGGRPDYEPTIEEAFDGIHNYNHDENGKDRFPGWHKDFSSEMWEGKQARIALLDVHQIQYWFGSNLDYIRTYYDVYEIEVPEIIVGKSGHQCIVYVDQYIQKVEVNWVLS